MFLDHKTMSYSAGHYLTGLEDLETAQQNKLDLISDWLNLPAGSKILDLGSGWGGFAVHASKKFKWKVTGYTLSKNQLKYSRNIIKNGRLDKLASFKYKDMLDLEPVPQFDAIVVIESLEHVGQKRLAGFFRQLFRALKPDGLLYIQVTGRNKTRGVDAWTLKYVFPGGYLPSIGEILTSAGEAGFMAEKFSDDTSDYLRTLPVWIKNLESHQADIEKKFDPVFYRLWELWTHGAKVAFEQKSMNLFRLYLRRPK
jgi:cyclopropane-fatty-acyl-phospholipid synthase